MLTLRLIFLEDGKFTTLMVVYVNNSLLLFLVYVKLEVVELLGSMQHLCRDLALNLLMKMALDRVVLFLGALDWTKCSRGQDFRSTFSFSLTVWLLCFSDYLLAVQSGGGYSAATQSRGR